jgi:hypothetical protein
MIGFTPPRPTGSNEEARFMQWVYDEILRNRPQQTPNAKTNSTTRGFFMVPNVTVAVSAGTNISMARVKQNLADTLVCRLWSITAGETGGDIIVCKPTKLRHRPSETIEGVLFNYTYVQHATYPTIWTRNVIDPRGGGESQTIVPRYLVDNVIYIAKCKTEIATATHIDLNVDGRLWARSYQSPLGEIFS